MNTAKELARGDEKLLASTEELLAEIPKGETKGAPLGNLYTDKPQFADPEKQAEEEEKALLSKMSNIRWLIYPYEKLLRRMMGCLFGRRKMRKTD